jgi:hypothetical protein
MIVQRNLMTVNADAVSQHVQRAGNISLSPEDRTRPSVDGSAELAGVFGQHENAVPSCRTNNPSRSVAQHPNDVPFHLHDHPRRPAANRCDRCEVASVFRREPTVGSLRRIAVSGDGQEEDRQNETLGPDAPSWT